MPDDDPRRTLTRRETATLRAVRPLLRLWTIYLNANRAVGRMDIATATGAPILSRHNPATGRLAPVLVNPRLVVERLHMGGLDHGLPDGLTRIPGPMEMASALEFMGVEHGAVRLTTTQRPMGEPERWRFGYRHTFWWQMSGQVWQRLTMANYVPSLAALPGRPSRALSVLESVTAPTGAGDEPVLAVTGVPVTATDRAVGALLLRDYLADTEPTVRMDLALAHGRPLVARRRGRAPRDPRELPPLATDHVLVSTAALAQHCRDARARLEGRLVEAGAGKVAWLGEEVWTPAMVGRLLAAMATDHDPLVLAPWSRFATVDRPGPRRQGPGWFRVAVSWRGGEGLDLDGLGAEWRELVDAGEREAERARERERERAEQQELLDAQWMGPEETTV